MMVDPRWHTTPVEDDMIYLQLDNGWSVMTLATAQQRGLADCIIYCTYPTCTHPITYLADRRCADHHHDNHHDQCGGPSRTIRPTI